jgi:F0F1-type ATP synthase assembly protein I
MIRHSKLFANGERGELQRAVMLGMNLAVGMAVFSFLGYYLDQRRGGGLAFTVGGILLGLGYGAYEVWRVIRLLEQHAADVRAGRFSPRPTRDGEPGERAP